MDVRHLVTVPSEFLLSLLLCLPLSFLLSVAANVPGNYANKELTISASYTNCIVATTNTCHVRDKIN